jgi:hypothetical protein
MWANPIGLFIAGIVGIVVLLAAIVAIVYVIVRLFTWWGDSATEATEKAAQKTEMLNDITEKYKKNLAGIIDYYKQQLDYIKQVKEAAQTPEQKTVQRRQELQNAVNTPQDIAIETSKQKELIETSEKLIRNIRGAADQETIDSFKERLKEAKQRLKELQEIQANIKPLTQVEIEIKRKEIIQLELQDRDLAKYLPKSTEAEELLRVYSEVEKMRVSEGLLDDINKLTDEQKAIKDNLDMVVKNAKAEFLKIFGKLESPVESFNKSIESLNDLAANVKAFGKAFDADELHEAKKYLFDQLKKDLGIEKFFNNETNTIEGYRNVLETNLKNIEIYRTQAEAPHNMGFSQAEFDTAANNAKLEYIKSQYGNLLEKTFTSQETYTTTLANLNTDLQNNRITQSQYDTVLKNTRDTLVDKLGIRNLITDNSKETVYSKEMDALKFAFSQTVITQEQYNLGVKAAKDKLNGVAVQEDLLKKFMPKDSPIEAFEKLSAELMSIKDIMNKNDFKKAKDKLLADLRSGLGIEDYLGDKDSLSGRKSQLAEAYKNLIYYANESGMTDKELDAAKRRALTAISEQSEIGNLYQEAISVITPVTQKLEEVYRKIDEEAKAWKWSEEVKEKMKEIAKERIVGDQNADAQENKPISLAQNRALEKGTIEYYEAQKRGDDQVLKENQKQTKQLTIIANNTKPQPNTEPPLHFTVIS